MAFTEQGVAMLQASCGPLGQWRCSVSPKSVLRVPVSFRLGVDVVENVEAWLAVEVVRSGTADVQKASRDERADVEADALRQASPDMSTLLAARLMGVAPERCLP